MEPIFWIRRSHHAVQRFTAKFVKNIDVHILGHVDHLTSYSKAWQLVSPDQDLTFALNMHL